VSRVELNAALCDAMQEVIAGTQAASEQAKNSAAAPARTLCVRDFALEEKEPDLHAMLD
jgi:hypothetical protein